MTPWRGAFAAAGAVVAWAVLARAASLGVLANLSVDAVFAERVTMPLRFEVASTAVAEALVDLPPLGEPGAPIEITEGGTPAGTAIARGHWTYAVTVVERVPDAVAAGEFDVVLAMDGREVGAVRIAQAVPNPVAREGARVVFDLGEARPGAPLFVVSVRALSPPAAAYRLESAIGVEPTWRGDGGKIEGATNPALAASAGEEVAITIVNGDGGAHRLRVVDAAGAVVAGPTSEIAAVGDEAVLAWTPPAPGDYEYECDYHATSMRGALTVT